MNWIERLQKDFRMVSRMRWPCLTRNQSEKKSYLRSTLEINIDRNILQDEVSNKTIYLQNSEIERLAPDTQNKTLPR